ncbi:MAG: T9SS type A sorting domain-containing protein [Bacteroidota bacterium]|nr:T9SS type A sorting domain-containing protein [Bacteroidota bacterium]
MNRHNSIVYLLVGMLFIVPVVSFAQTANSKIDEKRLMHHEVPNDKYVPVSRESMKKSPAYEYKSSVFFTTQVNIDENGNNIIGDAANEPSIAIDPVNPNRIVIGWRQFDDINNDFRQAGYGYSTDAGQTWTFPGVIDPGVFRSDPVLDFDANGNFYYNSLTVDESDNMNCDVYKIEDGGVEWDDGTYALGGDKQWMRIDRTDGVGAGNNYSFWSSAWSICAPGAFTRSTDGCVSFDDCVEVSGDPYWGTLAVGADGDLYMVGVGNSYDVIVVKSTTAKYSDVPVAWDSYASVDLDGDLDGWSPINPQGLIGQAWVDVDVSDGSGSGNVYVLASVRRSSSADPADVMFAKSIDGGQMFSSPIRINSDESVGNYQWFGTMSVAPNGRIDVVWLDTRDAPAGSQYFSSLYYSFSIDQGETWSENERLSEAFDPHIGWPQQQKMGDYFDMVSDNGGAHLAWANTLNGGQDVYYAHIKPLSTDIDNLFEEQVFNSTVFPNPFINETTIGFSLSKAANVNIEVYNVVGQKIKSLSNCKMLAGQHSVTWNGCDDAGIRLREGFYLLRLEAGNYSQTQKILLTK